MATRESMSVRVHLLGEGGWTVCGRRGAPSDPFPVRVGTGDEVDCLSCKATQRARAGRRRVVRKEDAPCCVARIDRFGRLPIGFCSPECVRRPEPAPVHVPKGIAACCWYGPARPECTNGERWKWCPSLGQIAE